MKLLHAILPDSDTMKSLFGMMIGFFLALWAWGYMSGVREKFVVLDSELVVLHNQLNALTTQLARLEKLYAHLQAFEKREQDTDATSRR